MVGNYPDGMDWGAYDDYHDPKLQCGCRSSDSCDCWCEHYAGDGNQHLAGHCTSSNCALFQCKDCGVEVENETDEPIICKECIAERGCQCKDSDRIVWIDCDLGIQHPRPARFATPFKDLREHWTLSYFHRKEQRLKEVVIMGIKCSTCYLEVE